MVPEAHSKWDETQTGGNEVKTGNATIVLFLLQNLDS
jgi:hypothetical protein